MANVAQRSFSAGEVSPAMYARADLSRYAQALRTLRNAVVLRTGGAQSRPGTEYLGATKGNAAARLVSAVFDTEANYVLEFGAEYVRFWRNGTLIRFTTPAAWLTATAYTVGTLRSNGGVNYLCLVAHTSGTFATDLAAGRWYALESNVYEWPTPYLAAELFDLQFATQLNVVTIVHPLHPPATLTFTADTNWVLADISFSLSFDAVSNIVVSGTAGSGWGYTVVAEFGSGYSVTVGPSVAIERTNQTETQITAYNLAMQSSPRTVTWTAVTGATGYSVYVNRVVGEVLYVQRVGAVTTFTDNGNWSAASTSSYSSYASRLAAAAPFGSAGEYPGVVGAYQQRLLLSGSVEEPDIVRASSVAEPYDFFTSDPIVDSDSMEWRQVGRRLNRVRHFVEAAQRLFQFSDIGESIVQGDTDGVLRPGEVNPRQFSENGAAVRPAPLVVNDTALYVQARGSMVRDLAPIQVGGFAGSDLTLQAAHLVDGYELVDWCYQQTPHSVVWAVREDGQLLSLTYVRELGILGWAHHDTIGEIESVCCVPEGTLDVVYVVVKRTIDSSVVRYVERFTDRLADVPILADAATQSATNGLDLVGSTNSEAVTVASTSATGIPRPTGIDAATALVRLNETATNAGHFWADYSVGADANLRTELSFYVRADQREYISAQVGPAFANIQLSDGTVSDSGGGGETWFVTPTVTDAGNGWWYVTMVLQYAAPNPPVIGLAIQLSDGVGWPGVTSYAGTAGYGLYLLSIPQVTGLEHLEGKSVSVVADGVVLASPNNPAYDPIVVTGGTIDLPAGTYTSVTVGLPYTTDIQTLDIDGAGSSRLDSGINVVRIGLWLEESIPPFLSNTEPTGDTVTTMNRMPTTDGNGNITTGAITGYREAQTDGAFTRGGRIFLRQVDPSPLTVLAIVPQGTIGKS